MVVVIQLLSPVFAFYVKIHPDILSTDSRNGKIYSRTGRFYAG